MRVTLVAAAVITVGSAAAVLLLVLSLRAGLVTALDDTATARASDAVAALRRDDLAAAVSTEGGDSLVQVLRPDGGVLAASPGLTGRGPLVRLPVAAGRQQQRDVSLGERDFRVVTQTVGDGRVVAVASPLNELEESLAQLAGRVLVGGPVLLGLICAAVWLLLGYTLRTVDRLRRQVAELSATGLDRRVDVPVARDEVRQLAVTMNDLLDRLQQAALTQRRFVADAAHELRSPLAGLRTRIEVNAAAGQPDRWDRAAPAMVADIERLARLVDDLLALARLDESNRLPQAGPVDLDEIVFAEVRRLRGTTPVVLDTRQVSAGLVRGDPDLLERVVRNVLANAVRHARNRVQVTLSTSDGQVELIVSDDGPGIPVAERERVFQRFHRLDAARGRDAGGSGLGLAIVHDAVRAHSGSVTIHDAHPGALVTIWLPQQQP